MGVLSKKVSRGVFGREVAEWDCHPLKRQMLLILDAAWDAAEPGTPYHMMIPTKQKSLHMVVGATLTNAMQDAMTMHSVSVHDQHSDQQAGRRLTMAMKDFDAICTRAVAAGAIDGEDTPSLAIVYRNEGVALFAALARRYDVDPTSSG